MNAVFNIFSLISASWQYMVGAAFAVAAFILFLIFIFDSLSNRSKAKKYVRRLQDAYPEKGVLEALKDVLNCFPEKHIFFVHRVPAVRKAILWAIDYLEESILRDYETAFREIEGAFPGKKVRTLHDAILNEEQSKKNQLLGIPDFHQRR